MKTKYLDIEIERLQLLAKNEELTDFGKDALDELIEIKKVLNIHNVSNWVAVKDVLPVVDGFYLVYSTEKRIWTKALYKMSEFHTIESDIDGYITHWKTIVKPPCC